MVTLHIYNPSNKQSLLFDDCTIREFCVITSKSAITISRLVTRLRMVVQITQSQEVGQMIQKEEHR